MSLMGILMMTAVVISVMATLMFPMFFVFLALVLTFLPTVLMMAI